MTKITFWIVKKIEILFKIFKILPINEIYNKSSLISIHINKEDYEIFN